MDSHDRQVLKKMLEHADSITEYCENCDSQDAFESDKMRMEACVFNLMQIGELAKSALSEITRSKIHSIPWKQIFGMRNRIVHGYSGIDLSIVWETVHDDIPKLRNELKNILTEL